MNSNAKVRRLGRINSSVSHQSQNMSTRTKTKNMMHTDETDDEQSRREVYEMGESHGISVREDISKAFITGLSICVGVCKEVISRETE
jgi:hypothetical protein